MLRSLTIRDFVIVDNLELDFESGFTALTGETGAGKSIMIDALSLALGAEAAVKERWERVRRLVRGDRPPR